MYLTLTVCMRLLGKRQLGELEVSELVVTLLIAELAALPLQDTGIPLMNGLVSILILFCLELIVSGLSLRSLRFRNLVFGKPVFLIRNGAIDQEGMRRCNFSLDELTEELRKQSVTDISKVQYAVLETDGVLNVILIPAEQPVTASLLNLEVEDTGWPTVIISDGCLLSDNLRRMGRNNNWLNRELKNRGVSDPKDVYLLTLNNAGQIYFARKESAS